MESAMLTRYKGNLHSIEAALSERIAEKRGVSVLARLRSRVRHMRSAAGHEAALRRFGADSALLLRVKAALGRIAAGNYGTCLVCHNAITPRHLNSVPWAAFCVRCRKAVDSREALLSWRKGVLHSISAESQRPRA